VYVDQPSGEPAVRLVVSAIAVESFVKKCGLAFVS
jgi:hypothetical protein